ncbi:MULTISPECIES: TetR/AcrR family transcriptional regulator [unclassified Mesorhizobium]|uniref:TetR/AcrR family transcriptional regulator n=1 Tax=unclassified Mesorhizobium TaxID=325217 RepID=UPI000BAE8146|nr:MULTISPECIES: TetR/AcrR family transcriptional regulator [unclassified Mesorhizobium]TGT57092.1 TetR/AcrR family transcriptional regulator [Mesorhizobium sp. M00.F.Ca.ET.170.01.1.1]PBB88739.1 TetR family transcriptional regulator [Mesorhizobium sp. WSM3876]RWB70585.1 MAG: TetR/AcrR family transcriptional regulator [Mesorhizobium sp.]RWB92516.1 MAG: TetR/AcrR family transcriptional regulator [Mesorhizobium sp.]RWE24304.1 MAG: TetR/AcrR family transcriptional regulator [Mesorhizobium sp.]
MPSDNKIEGSISEAPASTPKAADKILGVARDLFYREGIRAIGVDEIVKRAGVTKPSLYRSFPSKDQLAASYLRQYDREFWQRFDEAVEAHPGDPRAQIGAFLTRVGKRTQRPDYRGCGMTNAAVEYPEHGHPARVVSEANKQELRRRLRAMAAAMGAADPDTLGDGLLLLIEGAYISGQLFGLGGPAASVARNADLLVEASLKK